MLDPVTDVGSTGGLVPPVAPSVPVHLPNGNANEDIAVHTAPPVCMPSGSVNGDIAVQPAPSTVTLPIQEVTQATEAITIPNTIMNRSRSRSRSPENTSKEEANKLVAPKTNITCVRELSATVPRNKKHGESIGGDSPDRRGNPSSSSSSSSGPTVPILPIFGSSGPDLFDISSDIDDDTLPERYDDDDTLPYEDVPQIDPESGSLARPDQDETNGNDETL